MSMISKQIDDLRALISRQAAISHVDDVPYIKEHPNVGLLWKAWIESLPSAQPQPEEDCDTCKHGYFGDRQCDNCRVRYPSHYEREEGQYGSD